LKCCMETRFRKMASTGSYPRTDTLKCLKNRQSG